MAPALSKAVEETAVAMSTVRSASSFPLMDLPPEIRLRILEHRLQNIRYRVERDYSGGGGADQYLASDIAPLPMSIFQTCRRLRQEALSTVQHRTCLFLEHGLDCRVGLLYFTPTLHPLLLQNVSKVKADVFSVGFESLMATFPRLDTIITTISSLVFTDPEVEPDSQEGFLGSQIAKPFRGGHEETESFVTSEHRFMLKRSVIPGRPSADFKIEWPSTLGDLQRSVRILCEIEIFVGEEKTFYGKLDLSTKALIVRPGSVPEFESVDKWLEDLEV